jgi:hypothetical protein
VISGWVLKSENNLPTNSTDLHPVYFPGIFGDNGIGPLRKRRDIKKDNYTGQEYERYDGEVKVVDIGADESDHFDDGGENYRYEDDDDDGKEFYLKNGETNKKEDKYKPDDARWATYKALESVANGLEINYLN